MKKKIALIVLALSAGAASGQIRMTEWMYDGSDGEFIEFANLGSSAIDLSGWILADDRNALTPVTALNGPGTRQTTTNPFSLSGLGIIQPGEVFIVTEAVESAFRAAWNLPANVRVLGGLGSSVDVSGSGTVADPTIRITNGYNYGRADQINLYDAMGNLMLRFDYGDQTFAGTIRTTGASGNTTPENWGQPTVTAAWVLATVGDQFGSYASTGGNIGNPGIIPAPGAVALLGMGGLIIGRRRR